MLSTKPIPPRDRLIFALDVPSAAEALALADRLGDAVSFYKLGFQLFMAEGPVRRQAVAGLLRS